MALLLALSSVTAAGDGTAAAQEQTLPPEGPADPLELEAFVDELFETAAAEGPPHAAAWVPWRAHGVGGGRTGFLPPGGRVGSDGFSARGRRVTHVFFSPLTPFAFERIPWYEGAPFHLALLALFSIVFLSAPLVAAGGWVHRRLQNASQMIQGTVPWAVPAIVLTGWLNLVFMGGAAWAFQTLQAELAISVPPILWVLLSLPLLTTALTGVLILATVRSWSERAGTGLGRFYLTLVTLTALLFIPFLHYWNLLGYRF